MKYKKTIVGGSSFLFLLCSFLAMLTSNVEHPQIQASTIITAQLAPEQELEVSELDTILSKADDKTYFKENIKSNSLTDVECLSFALYGEARGESMRGIIAVAFVIHNRFKKEGIPSYCAIIKDRSQFSFSVHPPKNSTDSNIWIKIVNLSYYLINDDGFSKIESPVGNAVYFNSLPDQNSWKGKRKYITTIGNHHFYK